MANEKRLIDANDALERLKKAEKEMKVVSICGCKAVPMDAVIDFVASRPTVDAVEVVHGTWLDWHGEPVSPNEFYRWWRCSECKYQYVFDEAVKKEHFPSNYCPNCGAKMDGDGNVANE